MNDAIRFGIYVMEALFTIGMFGSAIVIAMTTVEDSEVFFAPSPSSKSEGKSEDETEHVD